MEGDLDHHQTEFHHHHLHRPAASAKGSVLLYGFGRNALGRFSIAAIYDAVSGSLKCEKKYMLTKFSARRGRRSLADMQSGTASACPPSATSSSGSGQLISMSQYLRMVDICELV